MMRRLGWGLGLGWTAAVLASFVWNGWHEAAATREMVREGLRAALERDVLYRRWASGHGGVYVPVTEATPPNPYLDRVPERDIETPSGRRLTLVNPAYMTRQVHELEHGGRGHITSLDPLRPENAADPWEVQSLRAFERGHAETSAVVRQGGELRMRLMWPLSTEEACLPCHGHQGYRVGEVRGGMSVSAPMAPYLAVSRGRWARLGAAHVLLWAAGAWGLGLFVRRLAAGARREHAGAEEIRATLYGIGDGVIATDAQGRVRRMNPVAETLTGWTEAEALGRPLEEVFRIVNEETRQPVESPVDKVLREGTVVGLANHTSLVARDGTERPIADSGAPVRTGSGELAGVVLVFRDQSAERASELALRRSEERFRLLFAHMQEGLALHEIVCDDAGTPVDYRFLEVNPAFERLTGLSAPQIVGKTVLEVLPHTEAHWIEAYGRVALTGEPAHFEEYSRELDRYYQVTAYCPKRGQFAVVFEEVTERRRAEVEREITVDLLRLLNASNDLPRLAQDVTRLLQEWSGCEAVGIRLRRGAHYPYFETRGFSSAGPAAEGGACAEAAPGGEPQLECLCRQVLEGRTDPARPYFTAEGTFWTNSRSDLWTAAREQGLLEGAPSRCDGEGYESVALVPLRFAGETFGLLQLNDRRRGRFSPERVALFERLAASLAVGLSQRRAAAELAAREAQARSILRAAPVGIGVAAQRVLREVNDAMTAITGYSREELLGQPARVLYASEADFEAVGRAYVQIQAGGRAAAETRWRRKDGRVIEVALHASVIDPSDPSQGITFVAQDITNFRRGERLAQARLALSSFAEDHGLEELLQRTIDEAEGLTESQIGFFHLVEPDQATLSLQAWSTRTLAAPCTAGSKGRHYGVGDAGVWADCIRERRAVVHNDYAALPNRRGLPPGHAVLVREAVVPVFRENRIVAVLGVGNKEADYGEEDVRDLSVLGSMAWDLVSRKRAEEEREALQAKFLQAQKMEAVGRLAGGVAHDFNNMLQVILGYTDLALAGAPAQSPLAENLRHVQEAAEHSAALTRQLLAFARRQTIVPRVLDLNEAVAGLLKMLGRLIGESIELVWRPSGRPAVVRMDPSQLGQVLANLVVNSRDALEGAGSITLETGHAELDAAYCAAHPGARAGPHVFLAVTDSGGGMDEQTRAHLFEPFFTTKPAGVGTGLGLATVYGIVKQNEGFVSVYSELGQGTSVKIYLPRHDAEPEASGRGAAPRELPRGSETVLLVEDEHSLLDLERRILEELGYTVLACSTPLEALEAADAGGRIDLLLTDVVLPGMSGWELRDRLAAKRPDLKCLFMSGYTANAIAHQGVLGDGVHFLQKPFSTADLAAKVREVLER